MASIDQNRFLLPAWGFSLLLHGLAVVLAVIFAAQIKPVLKEEVFKWDVALVEAVEIDTIPKPATQPAPAQTEQVAPPVRGPRVAARRPEPPPDSVLHRVAPQQTAQMMHPEVMPPRPVEQREEPIPPLKTEPVIEPAKAAEEKTAEPIEQHVVEAPKPQAEPVTTSKESESVHSAEPVMAQRQPVEEAVEARATETPARPSAPEPVASSSPAEPAPGVSEPPMQTAKKTPRADTKPDHTWLGESLRRRVAELQRYPVSARLSGHEGRVILEAVIRSDGHLADVSVQQSSGHQTLDAAAIETIRLACPLHMKHAINKPEIIVRVPIVYTLTN